jgi:uncharacterized membrane protein
MGLEPHGIAAGRGGYHFPASGRDVPKRTALIVGALALAGILIWGVALANGVAASAHFLVLIWLAPVLPAAYYLRRPPLALGVCGLFLAWVGLFVHGDVSFLDATDRLVFLPLTYLAAGVTLFAIGGTHYVSTSMRPIARTYRLTGLWVTLFALFALGLETFGGRPTEMSDWRRVDASNRFLLGLAAISLAGTIFTVVNGALHARLVGTTRAEVPISLAMIGLVALYTIVPLPTFFYLVMWNAVLVAMLVVALATGVKRHDVKLMEIGGIGLSLLAIARWVTIGMPRLPLGTFIVGLGVILALSVGGFLLLRSLPAAQPQPTKPPPEQEPSAPASELDLDPELQRLLLEAKAASGSPARGLADGDKL